MKKISNKVKENIKSLILRLTGLTVYRKIPFGVDPFTDLRNTLKNYRFDVFFDVGANVGNTANQIRREFPEAKIYCFEPFRNTYGTLLKNTAGKNINCQQIALGAEKGQLEVATGTDNHISSMNSLVHTNTAQTTAAVATEIIKVDTLTDFCKDNGIKKIDYLKIDTEGFDLEVLKGGSDMLQNRNISVIETELSMNPENKFHVSFETVKNYMESYGYRVFGIYEQVQEWPKKMPVLRRVNAVFISEVLYKNYKF